MTPRGVDTDGSGGSVAGFGGVAERVRVAATVVAVASSAAAVVDVLRTGFGLAVLARWGGVALVAVLAVAAVVVARDAYARAGAAQRRGDRLARPDVGILPPRRPSR